MTLMPIPLQYSTSCRPTGLLTCQMLLSAAADAKRVAGWLTHADCAFQACNLLINLLMLSPLAGAESCFLVTPRQHATMSGAHGAAGKFSLRAGCCPARSPMQCEATYPFQKILPEYVNEYSLAFCTAGCHA